jgi:hypothetical protein
MGKGFNRRRVTPMVALAALMLMTAWVVASWIHAKPDASGPGSAAEAQAADANGAAPTLDPNLFNGEVREAYAVARKNPALLASLHCYCGCDRSEGHRNLLDCYRDQHGSHCEICTGEALEAQRLFEQGTPVEQIRDVLRAKFDRSQ